MAQEAPIGGLNVPLDEHQRVFAAAAWPDSGVIPDPAPREQDGVEVSIRGRVRGIAVDFSTRLDTEFIDAALMALNAHHILPPAVAQMLRLPAQDRPSSIPIPEPAPAPQPEARPAPTGLTINGDLSVNGDLDVSPPNTLTVTGTATLGRPSTDTNGVLNAPSASPQFTRNRETPHHGTVLEIGDGRCGVVVRNGNFPFTSFGNTPIWALWRSSVSGAVDDYRHALARNLWPNGIGEGLLTYITEDEIVRWRGELENLRTDIYSLEPGWIRGNRLEVGDLVQNEIGEFGVVYSLNGFVGAMWRATETEAISAVETRENPTEVRQYSHRDIDGWFRRIPVPPGFHGDLRALVTGQPSVPEPPAPEPEPQRTGRKIIIKQ